MSAFVLRAAAQPTLVNLSTLGSAGDGSSTLYGGFIISGGPETVLVRGIGPGLATFGVSAPLGDPNLALCNASGAQIDANSGWLAADAATFSAVGAFALTSGSADCALVTTLEPGAYTALVTGSAGPAPALFEVYEVSGTGRLANLSTRMSLAAGGMGTAGFVISSGAGTRQLLIRAIGPGLAPFGVANPVPSTQLTLLSSPQTVVAQAAGNGSSATVAAAGAYAGAFTAAAGDSGLVVTLSPGSYTAQMTGAGAGSAMIEVYDVTGGNLANSPSGTGNVEYLAELAPAGGVTGSLGSGYASLIYNPNSGTVQVSLQFSGLSSPETSAHLELANGSGTPTILLNLDSGTGTYSASNLGAALQSGQLFVEIDTASNPGGELSGIFALGGGSANFAAPPAPPAVPAALLNTPDAPTAARFLTQATFGPTLADITALSAQGIPAWIAAQIALPPTLHLPATRADAAAFPNPQTGLPSDETYQAVSPINREAAWWQIALTAPDQLRQRVALALSELFVVSEQDTNLHPQAEALANYYDLLVQDAFGNFRQVLNDVSLSPVMGKYLTYLGNQLATGNTSPDENYAREVQQLFTIGLLQLQPDGSLTVDATGQPVPTFDQNEVMAVARVFTGWAFANTGSFHAEPPDTEPSGAANSSGWLNPMVAYDAYHDAAAKTVLGGTVLPAGQTATQDMQQFLDLLFSHPNVGPFVSRFLIQRLVTSNPSPGYVYRVAQVFANDGTGTRGNLAAVVTAILTDYEARSPDLLGNPSYGKIKEPLLRMTAFFRALRAAAPNGRYLDSYYNDPRFGYTPGSLPAIPEYFLGEGALGAPSVFNFFSPNYICPGPLAAAGLVAPEMELANAQYTLNLANEFSYYLYRNPSSLTAPPGAASPFLQMNYADYEADAANPAALLNDVNLVCCAGQMSPATRQNILAALQALQPNTSADETVAAALQLAATSPDGARQK